MPFAFILGCGNLESEKRRKDSVVSRVGRYLRISAGMEGHRQFDSSKLPASERTTALLLWDYPVLGLRMKDKPGDKVTHPKWKSSFSTCEFWSPVYKKCCLLKIYCWYSSPTLLPVTAFTIVAWDQSSWYVYFLFFNFIGV